MRCPICKRPLADVSADRRLGPFCSERCRLADLGSWLDGAYRITAPLSESDLDEGLPSEGGSFAGPDGKTPN
jgi:endogenous inhibitor of DNA gyrase (YacG/DUF329 family)